MGDREALLRAVCEHPNDDTPRLVFADWLDEHGEPERAELIRVQIELANTPAVPRVEQLRRREKELLTAHGEEWSSPFLQFNQSPSGYRYVHEVHYLRGFAYAIEVVDDEDEFADHAAELFRFGPIRRLVLWQKYQHQKLAGCSELLKLTELRTDRAGFEPEELRFLFASPYLRNLTRLELIADDDNGHLDAEGIDLLGRATGLSALRHIDLSYNWCHWMYETEWVERLTAGPLISQLESIRLRGTFLADAGAEVLARCGQFNALTHLDLAGNMIDDRGLRALAESPYLNRLAVLDLRENRYDTEEGTLAQGCRPETRRLLEARFGNRVLLDGDAEE